MTGVVLALGVTWAVPVLMVARLQRGDWRMLHRVAVISGFFALVTGPYLLAAHTVDVLAIAAARTLVRRRGVNRGCNPRERFARSCQPWGRRQTVREHRCGASRTPGHRPHESLVGSGCLGLTKITVRGLGQAEYPWVQ